MKIEFYFFDKLRVSETMQTITYTRSDNYLIFGALRFACDSTHFITSDIYYDFECLIRSAGTDAFEDQFNKLQYLALRMNEHLVSQLTTVYHNVDKSMTIADCLTEFMNRLKFIQDLHNKKTNTTLSFETRAGGRIVVDPADLLDPVTTTKTE
jgi:hypothetical protein